MKETLKSIPICYYPCCEGYQVSYTKIFLFPLTPLQMDHFALSNLSDVYNNTGWAIRGG